MIESNSSSLQVNKAINIIFNRCTGVAVVLWGEASVPLANTGSLASQVNAHFHSLALKLVREKPLDSRTPKQNLKHTFELISCKILCVQLEINSSIIQYFFKNADYLY